MVQSLHAEGVVSANRTRKSDHAYIRLSTPPNPANLPLVFLPAKFNPNDPLQRLGIAYMTKPGAPILGAAPPKSTRPRTSDESASGPQRKRRR